MRDLKVQELDAFFLGHMVPNCEIKMQIHMGLIPKFTLCDCTHQLLEASAADSEGGVLLPSRLPALPDLPCEGADSMFLSVIHPASLSSDGVTRESIGVGKGREGKVDFSPGPI